MSSSLAPVFPACTCCIGCASLACRHELSRRAVASAVPGTGIAIPARVAIPTRWSTPTALTRTSSKSGSGRNDIRPSLKFWSYLNHVADRFDLRPDITFDTRVEAAIFEEATNRWQVKTDDGAELSTQFLIMATGCISEPNMPSFDGMETFTGPIYHTARWPHEGVDLRGKRVAVIGTGSSGVQAIPVIARQAEHLTVFQRSPQWSVPAHNRPVHPDLVAEIKADYAGFRARNRLQSAAQLSHIPGNDFSAMAVSEEERQRIFEERWQLGGLSLLRQLQRHSARSRQQLERRRISCGRKSARS